LGTVNALVTVPAPFIDRRLHSMNAAGNDGHLKPAESPWLGLH
jgi:hypothetical protein